ncbi:hypothetical protein JCM8547_009171 [Rhodosporidiobolus lusitaniae]
MSTDAQVLTTPHLDLTVLSHGLILSSLLARPDDNNDTSSASDLLAGFANPDHHHHSHARTFFNCVVGRYANRLPSGELKTQSGASLHLPGAEGVCLHGGEAGFDTLPWTPLARTDSALFPAEDEDHAEPPPASDPAAPVSEASALHRIYSPAGADGFPCSLVVEVLTVVVTPKETGTEAEGKKGKSLGKVKVVMRAKINEDGDEGIDKGTPVNLTMHWGFRLDDNKDKDVLNHRLYLASDKLVALDDLGLSTGAIDRIQPGSEFDFSSQGLEGEHRTIGEKYPEGGIDRNFLFTIPPPSLSQPSSSARLSTTPQAILTSPSPSPSPSGRTFSLRFSSNQPSVQVYTASGLDGTGPARKALHGGPSGEEGRKGEEVPDPEDQQRNEGYEKDSVVFLEFQAPVGAFLHAKKGEDGKGEKSELGQWMDERAKVRKSDEEGRGWERDTVLRKGQAYENWVEMEVVLLE